MMAVYLLLLWAIVLLGKLCEGIVFKNQNTQESPFCYSPLCNSDFPLPNSISNKVIQLNKATSRTLRTSEDSLFLRLPNTLRPLHYDLSLRPIDVQWNVTVESYVRILIEVKESTDKVILNGNGLRIQIPTLRVSSVSDSKNYLLKSLDYLPEQEVIVFSLVDILKVGQIISFEVNYTTKVSDDENIGLYLYWYWSDVTQESPQYFQSISDVFEKNAPYQGWRNDVTRRKAPSYNLRRNLKKKYNRKKSHNEDSRRRKRQSVRKHDASTRHLRYIMSTGFQPTFARRVFPCFDEPHFKATFSLTLGRESWMMSLSNMPKKRTMPGPEQGWEWDIFATSPPMSSYLVAFTIMSYPQAEGKVVNGTIIKVWNKHGVKTPFVSHTGEKLFKFFEDYFGISHQLPKLDMVALPSIMNNVAAIENWGLIFYVEPLLLFDENVIQDKKKSVNIIAHEISHQWFGNLVTPKWWADIWLSEGTATYLQFLGIEKFFPEWRIWETFLQTKMHKSMAYDSMDTTRPLVVPIHHDAEILSLFDTITYDKGSSVMRMLSHYVSPEVLRKGFKEFLQKFKFKNGDLNEFWSVLTVIAHEEGTLQGNITVNKVMDSWTIQEGYPVVEVHRTNGGTSATVTQRRYRRIADPGRYNDTSNSKWWIPLSFANKSNFNKSGNTIWLSPLNESLDVTGLPGPKEWVIFNQEQNGFYHVNYDDGNWDLLAAELEENYTNIPVLTRMQLVWDSALLAYSGFTSYENFLKISSYLGKEENFLPIKSILNDLYFLDLMLSLTDRYQFVKRHLTSILKPKYDQLYNGELRDLDLEDEDSIIHWMCYLNYEPCVNWSKSAFKDWKDLNYNAEPHEVKWIDQMKYRPQKTAFCIAIKHGDIEDWVFMWTQFQKLKYNEHNRNILLSSLGCTEYPKILTGLLQTVFREDISLEPAERKYVLQALAENHLSRTPSWQMFREKWNVFIYLAGRQFFMETVSYFATILNTNEQLQQMKELLDEVNKYDEVLVNALIITIPKIKENIAWMERNSAVVLHWLQNYYSD